MRDDDRSAWPQSPLAGFAARFFALMMEGDVLSLLSLVPAQQK
jgi:hypothetical protein